VFDSVVDSKIGAKNTGTITDKDAKGSGKGVCGARSMRSMTELVRTTTF
jgi:hypothetical protein